MVSPKTTTIPLRIELEYMLDQRRLMHELEMRTLASLYQRTDSEELLTFLGLSAREVLNERKLRRRLRQIAVSIGDEKLRELQLILGRRVPAPSRATLENWVNAQAEAIQSTIEGWLVAAATTAQASQAAGAAIAETALGIQALAQRLRAQAERRASAAILGLNAEIIEQIARGAGSSHYRWMTENDDRVRENHRWTTTAKETRRHGQIYPWSDPPSGGGTRWGDHGHPGSGYGCRCVSIPIQGPPL